MPRVASAGVAANVLGTGRGIIRPPKQIKVKLKSYSGPNFLELLESVAGNFQYSNSRSRYNPKGEIIDHSAG
jgi:hypothetical protein